MHQARPARSTFVLLGLGFLAGACATVAGQSIASVPSQAVDPAATLVADAHDAGPNPGHAKALTPTVRRLDELPVRVAPSAKAQIQELARGERAFIGRLEMQAGAAVPEHADTTEEYIHVLEGAGELTIEGETYELQAGSTVFMPAKAKVSFQNGDHKMVALQVFAGPDPADKYERWALTAP